MRKKLKKMNIYYILIDSILTKLCSMWEHVAKWIGRLARDEKVWGSIPIAGHV